MTALLSWLDFWVRRNDRPGHAMWFSLAMLFALLGAGLNLFEAFSAPYVIQDDARQHVFWMQRFIDPDLFPGDLIADYFQAVAPPGYEALYRGLAISGIDPVMASKFLPVVLGLAFAAFAYLLAVAIVPLPAAGFLVAWAVTQNAWLMDNLASGTPRAFLYPLLVAVLFFVVRRMAWATGVTILLLGVTYPPVVLIAGGVAVLAAIRFDLGRPRIDRPGLAVAALGALATAAVLAPYAMQTSVYGPVISAKGARGLPEFAAGGRSSFFDPNPWQYWFCGERSGLLPIEWCYAEGAWQIVTIAILLGAVAAPFLIARRAGRAGGRSVRIGAQIAIVLRLLFVSVLMFLAAHVLLFELHLPSRYSHHSLRLAFDLCLGLLMAFGILRALAGAKTGRWPQRLISITALGGTLAIVAGFPFLADAVGQRGYVIGEYPGLYEFLQGQAKDRRIASLHQEADNLPSFAKRSVLVAREYAIPYHQGYYHSFRKTLADLVEAYYATEPSVVRDVTDRYGVHYWLVGRNDIDPGTVDRTWWREYLPERGLTIRKRLEAGAEPAIARVINLCAVFQERDLSVVDAECLKSRLTQ